MLHILKGKLTAFIDSKTGRFKIMLHILQDRLRTMLQLHILQSKLKTMLPLHLLQGSSIRVKLFMAIFLHQLQPNPKYCNKENAIETPRLKSVDINDEESRQIPPQHWHN